MTYFYERSEIYSFYDLNEEQKTDAIEYLGEDAENTSYVILRGDVLPLCMFMRTVGNFVHGYYVNCLDSSAVLATTDYGLSFHSILGKGNIFGTQFHPEKSHRYGRKILENFVRWKP